MATYKAVGSVKDKYKIGKTLGTGGFATVKLGTEKATNEQYALKVMDLPAEGAKVSDSEFSREEIFYEINILCGLKHPNVMFLKEYFEDDNKVYLITELLKGGELLDSLLDKGQYTEEDARNCFAQLLHGIKYLHSQKVVHRDLKLENLLLAEPGKVDNIKICDFGLAKQNQSQQMQTICGSPQYVAPEVLQAEKGTKYGPEVDLWSAGVILFALLAGYPPFYDESEPALFRKIKKGTFSFDDPAWDDISDPAKDIIKKLLTVDPKARLSASACLEHPWMTGGVSTKDLGATKTNMQKHLRRKLKGTVNAVLAINSLTKGLDALRP